MMQLIQARLRTEMPVLRTIDGLSAYSQLTSPPPREKRPAAYVLPTEDAGQPNTMATGVHRQKLTVGISVILICSNLRDPKGEAAATDMGLLCELLRAALVGWVPAVSPGVAGKARITSYDAMNFVRGELLSAGDPIVWRERFSCTAILSTL